MDSLKTHKKSTRKEICLNDTDIEGGKDLETENNARGGRFVDCGKLKSEKKW